MIYNLLDRLKESSKIGIICEDNMLSYKQWHQLSKKLSGEILNKSCGKIVGLFLPNSIAYAVSYFACLYADKVIAPFHISSPMEELLHTVRYCNISMLITTDSYFPFIKSFVQTYKIPMNIIVVNKNGETCTTVELYTNGKLVSLNNENELEDVTILLHTSGTTSTPKRVMLTNKGLLSNIQSHCESLNLDDKEVCLIQLPMMFGYCNTAQFLAHVYLGACIVINPKPFMIADFYKMVEKWHITNFTAVPSILIALLQSKLLSYDISSLKIICFGGGPISKSFLLDLISKFPSIAFVQTYGLTEAGPRVTTLSPSCYISKAGSVGCAIPGVDIKIIDTEGMPLKPGRLGEILVRSKGVMKGYYKSIEKTMEVLCDNWLYTGDIGYLSEDGFLYIVGRKKNIIITKGQNVCPEEVEEVILNCPGIIDVKVYGVYDDLNGELVCADIVVDPEFTNILQKLKLFCSQRISKYKIPTYFNLVDKICRTYNGKIKRSIE